MHKTKNSYLGYIIITIFNKLLKAFLSAFKLPVHINKTTQCTVLPVRALFNAAA